MWRSGGHRPPEAITWWKALHNLYVRHFKRDAITDYIGYPMKAAVVVGSKMWAESLHLCYTTVLMEDGSPYISIINPNNNIAGNVPSIKGPLHTSSTIEKFQEKSSAFKGTMDNNSYENKERREQMSMEMVNPHYAQWDWSQRVQSFTSYDVYEGISFFPVFT